MTDQLRTDFSPTLIDAAGRFTGYAAVFGNVDSHGDVIERGAFAASLQAWQAKGRMPPLRLMHGTSGNPFQYDDLPVGKWTVIREDARGLHVEGRLLALDTDLGRRLHALMAANVFDGLSIGYRTKRTAAGGGRVKRRLVEVELTEISLVDDPSNDAARVAPLSAYDAAADRLRAALAEAGRAAPAPALDGAYDKLKAALRNLA
ncbi:HK97 family phage prohead protease [Ensifer soli]|uniref:HK97 family phage prohead protease n=1 Tax=Ciceribacter sp. sgz301302 TaxID=3342379 RepID=UPI0035B8D2EE